MNISIRDFNVERVFLGTGSANWVGPKGIEWWVVLSIDYAALISNLNNGIVLTDPGNVSSTIAFSGATTNTGGPFCRILVPPQWLLGGSSAAITAQILRTPNRWLALAVFSGAWIPSG